MKDESALLRQYEAYNYFQDWKRFDSPLEEPPVIGENLNLRAELLEFGCQCYAERDEEGEKDSLMYQRYAIIQALKGRPTSLDCRHQANHIAHLAREHFDDVRHRILSFCSGCERYSYKRYSEVEAVPSVSEFNTRVEFCLRKTEWTRIRELYRSFLSLIQLNEERQTKRGWLMLEKAIAFDDLTKRTEPLVGEEGQTGDEGTTDIASTFKRVCQVLDFVSCIIRHLIPSHVFVLGTVPSDEELHYFGFSKGGLRRSDLYEVFSTERSAREAAVAKVQAVLDDESVIGYLQGAHCDASDLKLCREVGFRFHALLVRLRNCKERALTWARSHKDFITTLRIVCTTGVENGNIVLLDALKGIIAAIDVIGSDVQWRNQFDESLTNFRKACNNPRAAETPLPMNEACIHFVNTILVSDKQQFLFAIAKAVVTDSLRERDPTYNNNSETAPPLSTKHYDDIYRTSLLYDVKPQTDKRQTHDDDDDEDGEIGELIVAGEPQHKIRQVLSDVMTKLFDQLERCSRALQPQLEILENISEQEPTISLPSGRLHQSRIFHVASHARGGCDIVDLGFRSDGCYRLERHQGLISIEFFHQASGPTFDEAIVDLAQQRGVNVVRLQGPAVIGNMQQSVVVVCHVNRDTNCVSYETIIDGQNVSTENPVVVVMATDDTDPRNEIPFQRIAQYISGKTWRKCTEAGYYGAPIADKAVEVAAAVLAEYRLSDRSHELFKQNHSNFDVLKDIVYLSSKQLLYHLDALRTMIENKWKENLRRHKYEALAKDVEKLLIQDSRVLAMSNTELQAVNDMLRVLQFHVNNVEVDNQSFDSKCHQLSERSKKPSISFAHIAVVGHLDTSNVERLCDLVRGSSLRLLVVASPSTQHFAKVSHILQTSDAEFSFRATRITAFAIPLVVSDRYLEEFEPFATNCVETHTRRDFYTQVKQSQEAHKLTIVCRRGHELRPNDYLDLTREVDPLRTLREHLTSPHRGESHLVAVVDNVPPTLSLFVCGDSVVDAHIMYAPKVTGRVSAGLASLVGADSAITLSPEWQAVQDKMSQRLKEAIDFTDFVAIVPCCEWLDHRSRVQLYFLVVWGVPLSVTKKVLPAIRNVMSLPLAQTLMLSRESMRQKAQQIETLPSYNELVVGGTVTLSDVLQTSISYRVDIPWNLCYHQWRIAAPFSCSELTQILSIYPYPLRLLATLGSSIFHTLSGVELFAPSISINDATNKAASARPMLWAENVAKRLAAASTILSRDGDSMIPREHLTALSVMKWLFIIRGWNAIDPIVFDGADFSTLDSENIAMDILRADPEATAASSKRASMSQHTRHNVALMLATICGSPNLFSKQPQVVDYFLRPSAKGGITTESATALLDELLDPNNDLMIGAPFLSILKDSSLLNASALRRITAVNELWCWCNSSSATTTSASPSKDQTAGGEQLLGNGLRKISEKFSINAWGYLLATADTRQKTKKVVELLQSRKRDREILVPTMLNAAGLFASEVPTALDAITTVFLSTMADAEGDDFSTFRRNCPSLVHVLDLLFSSQKESKTAFDPMEYARKSLPGSPGVQFKVELEDSDKVLTFCLLQLNFLSDEAVESEFANAVLFFGRCLTEHDRHCFLRNVTELLLDSTSTTPGQTEPCLNIRQPTRRRLQVAAAVLWLHCPMAPCPLSTDASHALIKLKRFLSKDEFEMALSVGWPTEDIAMACKELWRLSNTFRYVVETEFEVVPYLALALIGWDHFLPRSFLQALHTSGVVVAPAAQTTTLVYQGDDWPTYHLSYAWRPLPESSRKHLFSPYNVKAAASPDASFDVSHGVSREKIQQNLDFFSIIRKAHRSDWARSNTERSSLADAVTTRLCIVLWLKAMGLFDGCESSQACEDRFLSLEEAPSSLSKTAATLRLPPALKELKEALTIFKKNASNFIITAKLPSFVENHVLRQSALLKLFESGSLEEVHYTLQTISAVLMVLPEINTTRPTDLFCHEANQPYYRGEAALASLVMGARVNNRRPIMDLCFRIVSCEIGYRIGHSWGQLDPENQTNVTQSVVSTLFLLLTDFPDRATEMLLIIVDVALEQLQDKQARAELCSTITMAIGFQDSKAIHFLMIPLFELMGDNAATRLPHMVACHNIIIKHEPTTVITEPATTTTTKQRALLLKSVAREVVYFRDNEKLISADVASTWLKLADSPGSDSSRLLRHITNSFPEPAILPQRSASKIVDDASFSNPFLPIPRLRSSSEEVAIAPTWTPSGNSSATTRSSLFRERGTGASHIIVAGRHGSSLETITPRDDMLLAEQQQRAHLLSHFGDDLANVAIDVSKIVHIVVPPGNIVSGWQVCVKPGLSCSLVRDHSGTLRIIPFKDLPLSNSSTDENPAALPSLSFADMTTCCHFEDYGEAWEFCFSRKHPSTLVGEGFLLTTSERGGWQILLGLAHGVKSASLRPWHLLAFHSIIHFELCGPSESGERGGRYQLMEWLCRRVCRGLEKDTKKWKKENVVDDNHPVHRSLKFLAGEEVQDVIIALTTSENDKQDHYCLVLQSFLEAIATKIREKATSVESQVIEEAIVDRLRSASQADKIILEHCGVRERVAMGNLVSALSNSLQFLSSSPDAMASIAPGPNVKVHHESTKLLFGNSLSDNDVRCQLHEVLDEEAQSNRRALDLIIDLYDRPKLERQLATEFLASEGNSDLALFTNVQRHQVDDTLRLGTGLQTGGRDDIFFGLAQTYDAAELQFHQIERKETYHHSTGLLVGVVIDKRLVVGHGQGNHALIVQWVLQVLRSPLPLLWKEWLILHLRVGVVGMPCLTTADGAHNFQVSIIVHLLAWRCEVGSVREILCSAFGELPPHCARNNRVYGVIAMSSPTVKEWVAKGYDVQEQDFTKSIPDDEEAFRHIVKKFGPMTTHVVVYGYDKEPMNDILLKWLCEYTFRYPWRFFVLVDCDTTSNLPENRDRVTNLMSSLRKRQTRTITLSLEEKYREWAQYAENLPDPRAHTGKTLRSCSWSDEVEQYLRSAAEATEKKSTAGDQILLIHLISPPGGGKSTLLQDLANHDIGQFVRFDCSDDRLVEKALRSLLNEGLAGIDLSKNTVLVVDEYHMLSDRKKHEFMQWAADSLSRVKIVLIANRVDPLDKMLLEQLRASHPNSSNRIRAIEGRISAFKVHTVIKTTYNYLDPDSVKAQSKKFYTFLSTLRGMLGDDAVSLRFEEHFPRFNSGQKVNNIEFTKRLLDKLIMFGQHSILRILDSYEQLSVLLAKQEVDVANEGDRRRIISRLYKDCLHKSPIKLLVFTSLLVPLLLYKDPTTTTLVQPCDEVLSYRDVVEGTPNLRLAPVAVRLMMWVLYVQKYVGITFDDSERRILDASLRRLDLVDFPDFPIIMKESSIKFYAISTQKSTFVNHNDLTDLDWIYRTLARRMAVNWNAIRSAWSQTPVTDSEKLCAIIEIAGPTTVFMAMVTSNVLQLLKRNPSGAFHYAVIEHYPLNRIRLESSMDESPYFFAIYSDMVQQRRLEGSFNDAFAATFHERILRPRGLQHDETALAKSFLTWISNCGSLVASVPNFSRERSESVVELVVKLSQMLSMRPEEEAAIWRGKYLAPVAELFAESMKPLIPVARAVVIVAGGVGELLSAHDKWPPSMKLLHRVVSSKESMLSEREAIYLLESGVLDQPVPERLVGALLQAEPPGWLPVKHQLKLLALDVSIGAREFCSDERYIMNARRNVMLGLRRQLANPDAVRLRCKEIVKLFGEMQRLQ